MAEDKETEAAQLDIAPARPRAIYNFWWAKEKMSEEQEMVQSLHEQTLHKPMGISIPVEDVLDVKSEAGRHEISCLQRPD